MSVSPPPSLVRPARWHAAFTLLELVLVIVIIGVIATIAVPRLSRGTEGTLQAAMTRDADVLQKAIDHYAAEHGEFPAPAVIAQQLTQFTDKDGSTSPTQTHQHEFGPYIRKVPAITVGPNKGRSAIDTTTADGVAWVYDPRWGTIAANTEFPPPTTAPTTGP